MTKRKSTKRALLLSALSLLMCVSMLVGSTFAWFTDSVTSAGNIIKSGTLDVTMEWADGKESPDSAAWADASKGAIFDYDKWEPGFAQVRHIKIANEGTLALKYQIRIVANGLVEDLAEVIDVYYADPAVQVANRSDLAAASVLGTLDKVLVDMDTSAAGELPAGESHMVTIALKMQESAGNKYQDQSIGTDFSVQLIATQDTYENDSFDDQYDVNAEYPLVVSGKKALNETLTLPYDETNVQIVVPAEAYEGSYSKVVTYENLTEENGEYTYAVDFAAELNGEKVDPAFEYQVSLKLPQFIDIKEITHNGKVIPLDEWEYDAFTGIVTFYTNSFSPFEVRYVEVAENPTAEGKTITGGYFTINPVAFDATLDDENSEYIAINYEKDGETLFVVANREDTLIVAADDAENYTAINGNYDIERNVSGNLFKAFIKDSRSFKLSANTVYLLPGDYSEATTLTISTDMDVEGLGNAEEIRIKKIAAHSTTTSKPSNRHLFNVSGAETLAEHIKVTISNLYLDATEGNTYKSNFGMTLTDDNAAIQSIRMSMVKCYDLTITDGNNASPFYVNGHYAAAGAYMYVENCTVTSKIGKIEFHGCAADKELFYYNNLTHNNGVDFSSKDNKVNNTTMTAEDWIWD